MPRFPLDLKVPPYDCTGGMRQFSWNRGKRLHAGCDLYAPLGTPVRAIAAGTVVYVSQTFTPGTVKEVASGAIAVHHPSVQAVVRYGEVLRNVDYGAHQDQILRGYDAAKLPRPAVPVRAKSFAVGDPVLEGDVIGVVGKVARVAETMVHFELYAEAAKDGVLKGGGVYERVDSLLDPTDFLASLQEGGAVRPGRKPSGKRAMGACGPNRTQAMVGGGSSRTVFERAGAAAGVFSRRA